MAEDKQYLDKEGLTQVWSRVNTLVSKHTDNNDIHVTNKEKQAWDAKADQDTNTRYTISQELGNKIILTDSDGNKQQVIEQINWGSF